MEQLVTILSYYPILVTALAIGVTVQGVKEGLRAFAKGLDPDATKFILKAVSWGMGVCAAIPATWMPTQVEGNLFIERLCLGMGAVVISGSVYSVIRRWKPALSSKSNA